MWHSFYIGMAKKVGVNAAIIYEIILLSSLKNKANNENFLHGRYWTCNSIKSWEKIFPYMSSKVIRNALKKLEDKGYIKTGVYNSNPHDRTKWYSVEVV